MPIVPTGSPAWVRNADHAVYGGHLQKANYQSQGVVNGRTDVGADAFVRMVENLAACTRTVPWAVLRVRTNDAAPAAPTILSVYQLNGVRTTSYEGGAAPAGFPSGARNGTGDVTLTWATGYSDDYSVAGALTIRHAGATFSQPVDGDCPVELVDAQTVRVRCFSGGAAQADSIFILEVW